MQPELIELREFLAAHPPFDQLPVEALERLPKRMAMRYLRRGSSFPPVEKALYIVRRGAVELRESSGALAAKLDEGGTYATACRENDPDEALQGHVVEDTLLYLLPCERFIELCEHHACFNDYFARSARYRLRRAIELFQAPAHGSSLSTTTTGALVARPLVHADPNLSIRDAAVRLTREGGSSLLLMEGERVVGIVTDRDMRERCIAQGLSPQQPVRDIMQSPVHMLGRGASGLEALLTMMRLNVHHLPVLENGRVLGVISAGDLLRHQGSHAVYLAGDVRSAESPEALAELARQLPELQIQMVATGASGYHVAQAVTAVTDALTRRLIALYEAENGPAPAPYAWVAVGSHARREQSVHSDQDHALIFADGLDPAGELWFERLATYVSKGLAACGFVKCPGEMMATNAQWRRPLSIWRQYFDDWIREPSRKALMLACNFFDTRVVGGDETLWEGLRAEVLPRARANGIFIAHLVANALNNRPPLGFFRNFVLLHGGEHDHSFDIKGRGLMPIADLARVHALIAGVPEVNTRERLRACMETGSLSSEGATDLDHALEFITTLRMCHQAQQMRRGEAPDNFINPSDLSALERSHLKDAFAIVSTMQKGLGQTYQSERFL